MLQQELTLQIALGTPLIAYQRLCGAGSGSSLHPSLELCQQVGKTPHLFAVFMEIMDLLSGAGGVPDRHVN